MHGVSAARAHAQDAAPETGPAAEGPPPEAAPAAEELPWPAGAPHDDYGLVAWCHGALTGYLDLHDQVMPEVTRIETTYRPPGRPLPHRCLLTRVPAALRPRSLKEVVEQLRGSGIEILDIPLIEKEAFRVLFAVGGGFDQLEASGVSGVASARANAEAYLGAILALLEIPTASSN